MRVAHYGNTANNAYYNARLLREVAGVESALPIRMFGQMHAISAPAWEAVDFDVPSSDWVANPNWAQFPEASAVNAAFSDLPAESASRAVAARSRIGAALAGRSWARPIFDMRNRRRLAARAELLESPGTVSVLYGADSLEGLRVPLDAARVVGLEHGTVRWIADGGPEHRLRQAAYRELLARAKHLWVTNLDPRTLEIAEDLVPGRWSAIPHPYVTDPRVPFSDSPERRAALLRASDSSALILLPASQNWRAHHDKGSIKAIEAFIELRHQGADVGLVAVEWGLQLAESKALLERAGVAEHVAWVPPMARFALQRMMANVDVVWDQFGLEAFGGLACRVLEQGTPLVSRGLASIGERLIGSPVPWKHAASVDDIVRQTRGLLDDMHSRGRDLVITQTRARYRSWLVDRHSAELTAALQVEVYSGMAEGEWSPGTAAPDRWKTWLEEHSGPERAEVE